MTKWVRFAKNTHRPPKAGGNFIFFGGGGLRPQMQSRTLQICKEWSRFLVFSRLRRCWTFWEHTLTPLSPQLTVLFTEIVTLFSVATTGGNQESPKAVHHQLF